MIVFDGSTGGLGRYLGPELTARSQTYATCHTRLEDPSGFDQELQSHIPDTPVGSTLTFVQLAAKVSVPECEKYPEAAFQTNVVNRLARARAFIRWARAGERR